LTRFHNLSQLQENVNNQRIVSVQRMAIISAQRIEVFTVALHVDAKNVRPNDNPVWGHAQICRQLEQSLYLQTHTALTKAIHTDLSTEFVDNISRSVVACTCRI